MKWYLKFENKYFTIFLTYISPCFATDWTRDVGTRKLCLLALRTLKYLVVKFTLRGVVWTFLEIRISISYIIYVAVVKRFLLYWTQETCCDTPAKYDNCNTASEMSLSTLDICFFIQTRTEFIIVCCTIWTKVEKMFW